MLIQKFRLGETVEFRYTMGIIKRGKIVSCTQTSKGWVYRVQPESSNAQLSMEESSLTKV